MPAKSIGFIDEYNRLALDVNELANKNEFWDDKPTDAEKIALIHSELSEALEGLRHGNPPDDKIPEYSSAEAELADAVIRIMDLGIQRNWNIASAILAKHEYNKSRPPKHGKLF